MCSSQSWALALVLKRLDRTQIPSLLWKAVGCTLVNSDIDCHMVFQYDIV
jgi:hypothetical protein